MAKKFFSVLLIFIIVLSFTSCNRIQPPSDFQVVSDLKEILIERNLPVSFDDIEITKIEKEVYISPEFRAGEYFSWCIVYATVLSFKSEPSGFSAPISVTFEISYDYIDDMWVRSIYFYPFEFDSGF